MQSKADAELLKESADRSSEAAFGEIVRRYTNLVYSAALRQADSPAAAAQISQSVFVDLERGAKNLAPRLSVEASLAGWLCRSARNQARNSRRNEYRRTRAKDSPWNNFYPHPNRARLGISTAQ